MNLVQKFPIGLGLACLMFMSSCSKEDALAPEPQMESVNGHSNTKLAAVPVISLPYFPSTKGSTGLDVYPIDWEKTDSPNGAESSDELPAGTSNLTHLWGNSTLPWKKNLPIIPNGNSIVSFGSIVTTTAHRNNSSLSIYSVAKTKIKNLKPGKKYEITFYVASTICSVKQNAFTPSYAKEIHVTMLNVKNPYTEEIGVEGKEAEWVKRTVTFQAINSEMTMRFLGTVSEKGAFSYAHMFVDKNAIKELN